MSGSLCCSQPAPPFPSCRLLQPCPPQLHNHTSSSRPTRKKRGGGDGDRDWLEVTVGREMQDLSV